MTLTGLIYKTILIAGTRSRTHLYRSGAVVVVSSLSGPNMFIIDLFIKNRTRFFLFIYSPRPIGNMILLLYGKYLTTEIKHCCIYIPAQLKCVYQCKPGKQAHVLNVMLSVLHGSLPDAQRIPETLSILLLQFSGIIKNIGGGCGSACPSETEVEYLQRRFQGLFTIIQKACGKTSIISKHCQFNMFDLIYM